MKCGERFLLNARTKYWKSAYGKDKHSTTQSNICISIYCYRLLLLMLLPLMLLQQQHLMCCLLWSNPHVFFFFFLISVSMRTNWSRSPVQPNEREMDSISVSHFIMCNNGLKEQANEQGRQREKGKKGASRNNQLWCVLLNDCRFIYLFSSIFGLLHNNGKRFQYAETHLRSWTRTSNSLKSQRENFSQ